MSTIFFRLSSLHWSFCALSSSSSVVVCSFYLSLSFFYPFPTVSFSPPFSPFFCPFFPFSFLSLSLFDLFTSFFHFSNFFHLSLLFLLTFLSFFFYPFFSVLSFFSLFLIFFSFLSYFFDTFLTLVFQFVTPFYFSACFSFFILFIFVFSFFVRQRCCPRGRTSSQRKISGFKRCKVQQFSRRKKERESE